jgi:hypothetical protein
VQFVRAPAGIISIELYKIRPPKIVEEWPDIQVVIDEGSDWDECSCVSDVAPCCSRFTPRCVRVEFRHACDAEEFVKHHSNILAVLDDSGHKHMAGLSLLCQPLTKTYSGFLTKRNRWLLSLGCTRTLRVCGIPQQSVFFALSACRLETIVDAEYDDESSTLCIEFRCLVEAHRAYRMLFKEGIPSFNPCSGEYGEDNLPLDFVPDLSTGSVTSLNDDCNPYAYISTDHLEKRFDVSPYNDVWPDAYVPLMYYASLCFRPPKYRRKPTPAQRNEKTNTNLRWLNNAYKLTPDKWSWEVGTSDLTKQCLDMVEYREALEIFFDSPRPGLFHLVPYQKYARVAAHRRERCAAEGLPAWAIPSCKNCEFGCRQARKPAGPPKVVLDYFNPKEEIHW